MLQRGNDLADLNEYAQLFSKEEQAANWSQFTGFSKELTADTGHFSELQYRFKSESHLKKEHVISCHESTS